MVLSGNNIKISSLDDIQKLEAKDLREVLKSNLKLTNLSHNMNELAPRAFWFLTYCLLVVFAPCL